MSTREKAARIRAQLKAAGYNARKVSIRVDSYSMGASIYATIRDLDVDPEAVRRICKGAEEVARCEITGDILSGGNTYVHVAWKAGLIEDFAGDLLVALRDGEEVEWNGWRVRAAREPGYFEAVRVVPRLGEEDSRVYCWGADFCGRQVAERVLVDRARAACAVTEARAALARELVSYRRAERDLDGLLTGEGAEGLDANGLATAADLVADRAGMVADAAEALARANSAAQRSREVAA